MILEKESNVTKAEFSKIVKLIVELFPQSRSQFTKPVSETWYEALSDLDYEKTRKGIMKYAQENQWSPSIADIRRYTPKSRFQMSDEEFNERVKEAMEKDE